MPKYHSEDPRLWYNIEIARLREALKEIDSEASAPFATCVYPKGTIETLQRIAQAALKPSEADDASE